MAERVAPLTRDDIKRTFDRAHRAVEAAIYAPYNSCPDGQDCERKTAADYERERIARKQRIAPFLRKSRG